MANFIVDLRPQMAIVRGLPSVNLAENLGE